MGSRPTAVDLSNAIKLLKRVSQAAAETTGTNDDNAACANVRNGYIVAAEKILEDDLTTNLAIGRYGAEYLRRQQMPIGEENNDDPSKFFTTSPPCTQGAMDKTYRKLSVLTHCNTGYVYYLYLFSCRIRQNNLQSFQLSSYFRSWHRLGYNSQPAQNELSRPRLLH